MKYPNLLQKMLFCTGDLLMSTTVEDSQLKLAYPKDHADQLRQEYKSQLPLPQGGQAQYQS